MNYTKRAKTFLIQLLCVLIKNENTNERTKRNFHLKLLFFHISYSLFFCSFCYSYQRTFCYSIYHLFFIRRLPLIRLRAKKNLHFMYSFQAIQANAFVAYLLGQCYYWVARDKIYWLWTLVYNLWNVLINILEWHLATINSTLFSSGLEVYFICLFIKNGMTMIRKTYESLYTIRHRRIFISTIHKWWPRYLAPKFSI